MPDRQARQAALSAIPGCKYTYIGKQATFEEVVVGIGPALPVEVRVRNNPFRWTYDAMISQGIKREDVFPHVVYSGGRWHAQVLLRIGDGRLAEIATFCYAGRDGEGASMSTWKSASFFGSLTTWASRWARKRRCL